MDLNLSKFDPAKKAFSFLDEFKKFAFKGSLIDVAIGIVIGAAFGKLVDSLVNSVVMPLISLVLPGQGGYTNWVFTINDVPIPYGQFLGQLVTFLIVAFSVYVVMVKFLGLLVRKEAAAPPPPTKSEELLTEIRDLLKTKV
jgi:large conductance mechanosensitive channel